MFALFCCCTFLLICSTNIHQFFLYFFLFPSDSEESDDDLTIGRTTCLLDKEDLDKSILFMLEQENQLRVKKLSISQSRVALNLANFCYRKDLERIVALCLVLCSAEVVDSHLSAVRRDHEKISQIEERRIRDDAALEEAKKKAVLEEKLHQEKAKAEAEAEVSLFQGLQFRYLPPGTGGTYWSARLSVHRPPATGRFCQKSTVGGRLKGEIDRRRSIEGEIDRRRSIEREKGRKKKKRKKKKKKKRGEKKTYRSRAVLARAPSPTPTIRGHSFSRAGRKIEAASPRR
ncbi:hypothetical protein BHM03_00027416 [Ensete ventricosum]|nr:hypothetical protein BHM03_00027416 [Ensete ventricosum]